MEGPERTPERKRVLMPKKRVVQADRPSYHAAPTTPSAVAVAAAAQSCLSSYVDGRGVTTMDLPDLGSKARVLGNWD